MQKLGLMGPFGQGSLVGLLYKYNTQINPLFAIFFFFSQLETPSFHLNTIIATLILLFLFGRGGSLLAAFRSYPITAFACEHSSIYFISQ